MGFDGRTPPPGEPTNNTTWHRHEYWNKTLKRWVQERCNCATGKYHRTSK